MFFTAFDIIQTQFNRKVNNRQKNLTAKPNQNSPLSSVSF